MKLIVDISHPAHYHFFKNAIVTFKRTGHRVLVVSRDKDITEELLDSEGVDHIPLSKRKSGFFGLAAEMFIHERGLYHQIKKFRPDALLQIGGTFIVHVGKLTAVPSIVFYDTENAILSNSITYPFADVICTPASYKNDLGAKHVRYAGYQELAYLHPNQFSPDPSILEQAGLKNGEIFSVIRFVGWSAAHDINRKGFSAEAKILLVNKLAQHGRVFISAEAQLPSELGRYAIPFPKSKIHHLLAFATLYIGESATMASESAMLGTPSIFFYPERLGYTDELEDDYGLVVNFIDTNEDLAIDKAVELLATKGIRGQWQAKREKMLSQKTDVTAWMVKFVEDFVGGKRTPETWERTRA